MPTHQRRSLESLMKRFSGFWVARVAAFLVSVVVTASPGYAAPTLTLARPEDASRFRVTTFATGLSFPTSVAPLSDGSLLVGTSDGSSLWGSTSGRLVRLVDANGDGVADSAPQALATGLPGIVTSVRRVGDLVVALSSQTGGQAITFWRTGAAASDSFTSAGQLSFSFPGTFEHTTFALAARQVAGDPTQTEVYFNIGAAANSVATPVSTTVGPAGSGVTFSGAALVADSVHRVVVTDSGGTLQVSAPVQIASGLRNAAGMTFDAEGNLLLQDNGIDTEGNRGVSFSADELNRVSAADLGTTVPDFGFADTYIDYATGATVGPTAGVTAPLVDFRPVDGERSEGAVEIAMAPDGFASDFDGGVFVAFYGMPGGGTANEENPVVFANPSTGDHYHFIENQLMGHPNGLLSMGDSLWLTDLSYTGSLSSTVDGVPANEAGVIYQITAVPEPSTWMLLAAGGGVVVFASQRRRRLSRPRHPRSM